MEKPKNDDLIFQAYLVIFFDLLGQREILRKITGIPNSDAEKPEFLELVKKSLGNVLLLRDAFKNYFEIGKEYLPDTTLIPPEHREKFIESQKTVVHYYGLSDAIVIAVPLMNDNDNCTPMNGVFSALTATCAIHLLALSLKIPTRAGIDIGVGVQIDDHEIYGPALERAVRIEGQLAEYPRLVVGYELYHYLTLVENQEKKTPFGEIASSMAILCKKLLIKDSDGRVLLDFLGKNINDIFEHNIEKDTVLNAWAFVKEEHKRQVQLGDDELSARYFRMIRYLKSRISLWGIE